MHVSSTLRQESLPRFRYRLATGIYRHAGERKREGETERERDRQRERVLRALGHAQCPAMVYNAKTLI